MSLNDLSIVPLQSADGATAEIYLHGAHLTSWKTPDGTEQLFLSPRSEFKSGAAIRGGVPVIFPQFSGLGPLPKHGFARNHAWELVETQPGMAKFRFSGNEETRAVWPHSFVCELLFRIGGRALEMEFTVQNIGTEVFDFHAALHGYFTIESLSETEITGLGRLRYRDNPTATVKESAEEIIRFGSEIDRTFYAAGSRQIELHDGVHHRSFTQQGFQDSVVWNPGPEVCAKIPDLEPTSHLHYVCVEAAGIEPPPTLAPGIRWTGIQRVETR